MHGGDDDMNCVDSPPGGAGLGTSLDLNSPRIIPYRPSGSYSSCLKRISSAHSSTIESCAAAEVALVTVVWGRAKHYYSDGEARHGK